MKRLALVLAIVAAIFAVGCATQPAATTAAPAGGEVKIAVLHVNDTHGHPLAFDNGNATATGGLAAMAMLVGETRAEYDNVLVLDAGDFNTGLAESNFFKAEPDIIGRNLIGFDAVALGNHEFDNELSILETQKALAEFPMIAANVKTKDGAYIADAPYIVKTFQGVKVGIFGLITKETETVGNPVIVKDLVFLDEIETGKEMVKILREKEKVQVVIALVHLGFDDLYAVSSKVLAKSVPGIDLIVDGHSHTKMAEPFIVNGTPIVQAHQWGLIVGKGVISVKDGKVSGFAWEPVTINDNDKGAAIGPQFAQHPLIQPVLADYRDKVDGILKTKIGTAADVFPNAMTRKAETAIGDLVTDAMKFITAAQGVDFAMNNGGGIRADLPAGDVTMKSVYTVLPFDNSVTVIKLKGTDVQAMFDFILTTPGKGAFAQVSDGVSYTINLVTNKIENVLIGGKPIDPAKVYTIATNSYLATGGDGYTMFKNSLSNYETSMFQRDALIEYVQKLGKPLVPEIKGRITIIAP
ncbi:MAG: 5'-nucleotidase C-terminal domain-containing protein [Spirochaetia bacterium]|jgi:5'-nucleotidase/UDP-sugar diphosphatase|nr:5'-nucleotidase C-terminal domain-containing protein [Spirochaetia bacterium]